MCDISWSTAADTWSTTGSGIDHCGPALRASNNEEEAETSKLSFLGGYRATLDLVITCVESHIPIVPFDAVQSPGYLLGRGASCNVLAGEFRGLPVAIKMFRYLLPTRPDSPLLQDLNFQSLLQQVKMEIITMSDLHIQSHGNICRLLAVCLSPLNDALQPTLVLERAHQTLDDCLQANSFNTPEDRLKILLGIANGVISLHEVNVVHGDLKPSNCLIFLNDDGRPLAKVSDFGYSRTYDKATSGHAAEYRWGTRFWDAPECLENAPSAFSAHINASGRDMYSLGMLMVYIVLGEATRRKHAWPDYRFSKAGDVETELADLDARKLSGDLQNEAMVMFNERFGLLNPEDFAIFEARTEAFVEMRIEFDSLNQGFQAGKVSSLSTLTRTCLG